MLRRFLVPLLVFGLLATPAFAADETQPDATAIAGQVQQAKALLQQGKLQEALTAYQDLSKAYPDNKAFAKEAQVLAKVIELREFVKTEDAGPGWDRVVTALHGWYHQQGLEEMALEHDMAAHAKADSADTAALVAQSLLELGRNEQAATFVTALREGQKNEQLQVMNGIAHARLGKMDAVKAQLELYPLPEKGDAGMMFDVARLQTLMGENEKAMATLTRAFENCPPRATETLQTMAKESPDLASLRRMDGFAKVLETTPKASDCGSCGGCDEGGCPSAGGGCGSSGDCPDGECPDEKGSKGCGSGGGCK